MLLKIISFAWLSANQGDFAKCFFCYNNNRWLKLCLKSSFSGAIYNKLQKQRSQNKMLSFLIKKVNLKQVCDCKQRDICKQLFY